MGCCFMVWLFVCLFIYFFLYFVHLRYILCLVTLAVLLFFLADVPARLSHRPLWEAAATGWARRGSRQKSGGEKVEQAGPSHLHTVTSDLTPFFLSWKRPLKLSCFRALALMELCGLRLSTDGLSQHKIRAMTTLRSSAQVEHFAVIKNFVLFAFPASFLESHRNSCVWHLHV